MSAILFCLFGGTHTLESQLDGSTPFQRPSFLRPAQQIVAFSNLYTHNTCIITHGVEMW